MGSCGTLLQRMVTCEGDEELWRAVLHRHGRQLLERSVPAQEHDTEHPLFIMNMTFRLAEVSVKHDPLGVEPEWGRVPSPGFGSTRTPLVQMHQ